MADHDQGGISSSNSTQPPHLRAGSHLPTSDVQQSSRMSSDHGRQAVSTQPWQDVPRSLEHAGPLRPTLSMTCFDAGGDDYSSPSDSRVDAIIRLKILPSGQEKWSPTDYLRGDCSQALCFYLSSAPAMSTLASGTDSSDLTESSAMSPSFASSSLRESQSSRDVHLRFAGEWKRTTYEKILLKSLMDFAEKSTARCPPCPQDAGFLPVIKERIKVYTKVDKCFFRVSVTAFQGAIFRSLLCNSVEPANLEASFDLEARCLSINELGDLISSRHLIHQSVARATTAKNIINGRNHLLISGIYEAIPQRSCKIFILCSDREHPADEYQITLVYETDATAAFPEQQEVHGAGTQNQKLYCTWRKTSNAKILSINIKRSPRRHCFVHFLRQRKGFDFRLGVENRQVPQTEPCEAEIREWITQAWNRRSKKGILTFSQSMRFKARFKIRVVRYKEFMEAFKSKNFKVKMSKVTQTTRWDHVNMTSEWECLLQSIQVKKMCHKGINPDDVDLLVPLLHELVEETTKLTLAMGDVNLAY